MGATTSSDELVHIQRTERVKSLMRQHDVGLRVEYCDALRAKLLKTGASVSVLDAFEAMAREDALQRGVRSYVRYVCVPSESRPACAFVAVLKCVYPLTHGDVTSSQTALEYDVNVGALLTRLVRARITPHFTMVYHVHAHIDADVREAAASTHFAAVGGRCALLEVNDITAHQLFFGAAYADASANASASTGFYRNPLAWLSMLAQTTQALLAAYSVLGFSHNDLHINNIMGVQTIPGVAYRYVLDDAAETAYTVALHGWLWKVIDFDHADLGFSRAHGVLYARRATFADSPTPGSSPRGALEARFGIVGPVADILLLANTGAGHRGDAEAAVPEYKLHTALHACVMKCRKETRRDVTAPSTTLYMLREMLRVICAALDDHERAFEQQMQLTLERNGVPERNVFRLNAEVDAARDVGDGALVDLCVSKTCMLTMPGRLQASTEDSAAFVAAVGSTSLVLTKET